ncbi:MAG TPA: SDR family NAD(P)-dependent oxidoreductase [Dongiaceae bacterium]|jgi:NAD(P)-dependent dehydrogenase (short-subunit alcohol dehydrogenase family)|nr:SDR family NAD(P)-dependent oxidoreductase [Dongiaceae bacterium]
MIDLNGKTILVTGGSRGIGEAIVRSVAAAGGTVLLHYSRSREAAEAIQKEIGPQSCKLVQADLEQASAAADLWRAATKAAPRIDVLINNAGIFEPVSVDAPSEAWHGAWARVTQVNLYAPAELCKLAIGHFRGHGGGKIINVASRAAHRGDAPDQWPYAASKGALVALTKTIARGFAKDNVLAFAIAPGFTDTDMAYTSLDDAGVERVLADIPLGSMVSPAECGALAAFLCSDQVRHMTGATFDINGASYVR